MNKLIVPKRSFFMGFADLFDPFKRAMSSKWFLTPIFWTLIITILGLLSGRLLKGAIDNSSLATSAIISTIYYYVEFSIIKIYRKKIIADMESAHPLIKGHFDSSSNSAGEYIIRVETLAGDLKLIGKETPWLDIKKKHGQLFDYYVYENTEGIDQRDLKKFVVNRRPHI